MVFRKCATSGPDLAHNKHEIKFSLETKGLDGLDYTPPGLPADWICSAFCILKEEKNNQKITHVTLGEESQAPA